MFVLPTREGHSNPVSSASTLLHTATAPTKCKTTNFSRALQDHQVVPRRLNVPCSSELLTTHLHHGVHVAGFVGGSGKVVAAVDQREAAVRAARRVRRRAAHRPPHVIVHLETVGPLYGRHVLVVISVGNPFVERAVEPRSP